MQRLTFSSFLLLLCMAVFPQQGQAYNITESVTFAPSLNCNQIVSPADLPAYSGPTVSFTYTHNFQSGLASLGLTMAPNPQTAGSPLRVQMDLPEADKVSLEVFSLDGKQHL